MLNNMLKDGNQALPNDFKELLSEILFFSKSQMVSIVISFVL